MPEYSGGAWGGVARGIQDSTGTAMQALGTVAQMQHNKAIEDTQAVQSKIMLNQEQRKQAEVSQQQAELNKSLDITTHPAFLGLPSDQAKKAAMDFFTKNGFTDEKGVGTNRSVQMGVKMMESSKPAFEATMGPVIEGYKQNTIKAYNEKQDAIEKAKGNEKDEKVLAADSAYKKAANQYQSSLSNYGQHLDKLSEIEAQGKQKIIGIQAAGEQKQEAIGAQGDQTRQTNAVAPKVIPGGAVLDRPGQAPVKNPKTFSPNAGGSKTAKLTANVGKNPESGKSEYLMSDGSFSGKEATAKPKAGAAGSWLTGGAAPAGGLTYKDGQLVPNK